MNQVWFDAATPDEAQALMNRCMEDDMNVSDLPNARERNRGIELDFSVSMLESGKERDGN